MPYPFLSTEAQPRPYRETRSMRKKSNPSEEELLELRKPPRLKEHRKRLIAESYNEKENADYPDSEFDAVSLSRNIRI